MIKVSTSLILNEQDMQKLKDVLGLVWSEDLEKRLKTRRLFSFAMELKNKVIGDKG